MASIAAGSADGATAPRVRFGALALAGTASLGAGAIHAAAIGVHGDHPAAARTFAVLALLQIAWGALALVDHRSPVAFGGFALSVGAFSGWVLAKTTGLGFIDGLGEVEGVQWPDFLAALLALAAALLAIRVLIAGRTAGDRAPKTGTLGTVAFGVLALTLVGMTTTSTHQHADGAGHVHGTGSETAAGTGTHDHTSAVVAPAEYDPTKPVDLSGVAGVTPQEQKAAEDLVNITLKRLPQFADYRDAEARGFLSIGDGFTGAEHFIKWDYIDDDKVLDPDYPESLVYEPQPDGSKKLVSAMFMLAEGSTLEDTPVLGGALTQWHIHDNLCFTPDVAQPRIAGITSADGTCGAGLKKFTPVPMIHVWITKNPCGPFAALEGVGAGQVKAGEERLCDHVHGSSGS